ncbi:hypothetical protein A0H81_14312 [Grifola frondosa]|uniref:Arrestin C-terminal-like domain-containing protein n=1 Tax=Grifola frondosa TaxID=5627 RepID=A0A1C7LLP9_GRIFR|nr:hypothetical protein A0H81_14312 [Grifola frondosa]
MSQPKLTLRPPPNIDFVQGYPGIPPGAPDRPQAAVKGAIEVRVGPQGVKAKWVRIELRKIETLPGGGLANTFFDFVGQSPINLWQSSEEYATLHTQDFPFFIRIPESIPPTIALEKGAGIKYELIASVCVQGKKGFLRRDKPSVTASASTIIIDKHELHSTWPVYAQPETRHNSQDGVTLIVERGHTCFGPGDRVVIMAIVKSDTLHTVILRGFEFMLRETTVFRAGPHTQGKKGSPQVKVASIGEQKVPVNATLYGGTQHKAELSVTIPTHHTSATITAARHIDITYVLTVKALMGTGQPLIMDLPVVVSNWPRNVSLEAMRRIGMAPNLCLVPGHPGGHPEAEANKVPPQTAQIAQPIVSPSVSTPSSPPTLTLPSFSHPFSSSFSEKPGVVPDTLNIPAASRVASRQFNTAPTEKTNGFSGVDEFGSKPHTSTKSASSDQMSAPASSVYAAQTIGGSQVASGTGTNALRGTSKTGSSHSSNDNSSVPVARPRSTSARQNAVGRLTVANFVEDEIAEHPELDLARQASLGATPTPPRSTPPPRQMPQTSRWMTAEEEKKRLYETAVANVERIQSAAMREHTSSQHISQTGHVDAGSLMQSSAPSTPRSQAWPTAEEEKARLFNEAQAAVMRTQARESSVPSSPTPSHHTANGSFGSPQHAMSTGAALYSHAMSSISRTPTAQSLPPAASGSQQASRSVSQFPPAEYEKAALRRYYDAKAAVDRTQGATYDMASGSEPSAPISYDALYPSQPTSSPHSAPVPRSPPPQDLPPPFPASSYIHPILSEKERLRRHFEAQDAGAVPVVPPPNGAYVSAPSSLGFASPPPFSPASVTSAFAEKEMLRRRFEAQDAAARAASGPPTPPLRDNGSHARPSRSPPLPPAGSANGSRPLTAVEEKARLKAMYDAEERGAQPGELHTPPYSRSPVTNGFSMPLPVSRPLSPQPTPFLHLLHPALQRNISKKRRKKIFVLTLSWRVSTRMILKFSRL